MIWKNNTHSHLFYLICIGILSFLAYSNSFHATFQFDDLRTIRFNFSLRDWKDWKDVFLFERFRPVLNASFALNYSAGKLNPYSYHVVNLVLHITAVILFYFLLCRRSSSRLLCFLAAALMAVHPLNTESVTYVSSRSILLCSILYFLALLVFDSYLRKPRWFWLLFFIAFFLLGSLTKEEAAMLPVAALLYNYCFYGRDSVRRHRIFHVVTLTVLVAGAVIRFVQLKNAGPLPFTVPTYFATEMKVWWHYVWLAAYPLRLNVDPDIAAVPVGGFLFWLFLMMSVGGLYSFLRFREKHPFMTFWGLWFWFNLLLSSSMFPLNDFMAEHRAYLSVFGFCACVSYSVLFFWRPRTKRPWIIPVTMAILIFFYSLATYQRNRVWANEFTLWYDSVQKSPYKIRPHLNLGGAFLQRKAYDLAVQEFLNALTLNPDLPQAYSGIGICYLNKNDLDKARSNFEKALKLNPRFTDANVGLGMVHYRQGNYQQALAFLVPQLSKRRESAQVVYMIADSHLRLGHYKEALELVDVLIGMGRTEVARNMLESVAHVPEWNQEATRRLGALQKGKPAE